LLDSSHVVKVTSVKFVVNCLVVYGKSLWKVSVEQRVQIIKFYYQNQCSVRETFRALRDFYPHRSAESTIRCLVAKFESIGSINNQPNQYVAETQDLLKTSLLCVRVYGKTRGG